MTVGLNNTPGSIDAAYWGAHEASLRKALLRLVCAWEWQPYSRASLTSNELAEQWSRRVPVETAAELRHRYPDLHITAERLTGPPTETLCRAAGESQLLAIGSGGLATRTGFLGGSVASATVSLTERPVVLVGSGRRTAERDGEGRGEHAPAEVAPGPVVVAVDLGRPSKEALRFAFEEASLRRAPLDMIHGWNHPAHFAHGTEADQVWREEEPARDEEALQATLTPWSERYPEVPVREHSAVGKPARDLADAGAGAALVVLSLEAHQHRRGFSRVGHMTHALLRHCPVPVAVVPRR
ncbi:universal stress protein [Streptomyces camponoticapitis]|uniref:universal stress protein n=1 Tax=Streptomyces camponoticapitis TaxID=1616125 RepID=UPI0016642FB1|nr:universal stress protein [Streptomyces camponoticapitis]